MKLHTLQFTAGRLLCGKVRNFLNGCRLAGLDINWFEGKGFFTRTFIGSGNEEDILYIYVKLKVMYA